MFFKYIFVLQNWNKRTHYATTGISFSFGIRSIIIFTKPQCCIPFGIVENPCIYPGLIFAIIKYFRSIRTNKYSVHAQITVIDVGICCCRWRNAVHPIASIRYCKTMLVIKNLVPFYHMLIGILIFWTISRYVTTEYLNPARPLFSVPFL